MSLVSVQRFHARALVAFGLFLSVGWGAGCRQETRLCRPAAGECGDGRACVAGRCVTDGPDKNASAAAVVERWTAAATALRVVGHDATNAFRLGGDDGASTVLFSFPTLPKNVELVEAFLLIPRDDTALPGDGPVALRGDVPDELWIGLDAARPAPHLLGLDAPRTIAASSGARLLRVDVAEALRRQHGGAALDLALLADAAGKRGVPVRVDLFGGPETGVRLDVYYRSKSDAKNRSDGTFGVKNPAGASSNADPASQPFAPY